MRKYEPDFDLFSFENEVDEVLKQLLNAFFHDDLDTVQKLSGNTALGMLTGVLRTRKEMVRKLLTIYFIIRGSNANIKKYSI
jgi:hypothetical protein